MIVIFDKSMDKWGVINQARTIAFTPIFKLSK
jgi:hypothetical protein